MSLHKVNVFISLSVIAILGALSIFGANYIKNPRTINDAEAASETINTLDYFVSKNTNIQLADTGGSLGQVINGQTAYYVKYSSGSNYEKYSWDSNYIYVKEDRSQAPGWYYTTSQGNWMKRTMKVGESIVNSKNVVTDYSNCASTGSRAWPYTMTLEKHITNYDLGGDLGVQDVIQLKDDYYSSYEVFFYSKKWGWVKWQLFDSKGNLLQQSVFNKILQVKPPTNTETLLCAKCISTTIPAKIAPGTAKSVTVSLKNTGGVAWKANTSPNPYSLGSQDPSDNKIWGLGRLSLSADVAPGKTQNFTFQITAPTAPGTYSSRWQLLREGLLWFGDKCGPISVTVSN